MPFHLAACCSRTVNSLIAGWKTWTHTLNLACSAEIKERNHFFMWSDSVLLAAKSSLTCLSLWDVIILPRMLLTWHSCKITPRVAQWANRAAAHRKRFFTEYNKNTHVRDEPVPPLQVGCLAMQHCSSYISCDDQRTLFSPWEIWVFTTCLSSKPTPDPRARAKITARFCFGGISTRIDSTADALRNPIIKWSYSF